ncbi:MAG: SDR family NAD(P)-dependent oxidoreductase [Ignavibacteria bacterium]|nr:SDR family NAD(P)-dependent oxidoreductase [Ignavibacteria bacterium]
MKITESTVAVITGASSGIGAALAIQLANRGASVALVARRKHRLDELVQRITSNGGKAVAIVADVSVKSQAEQAITDTVSHFGGISLLINNAGRGNVGSVEDTTSEQLTSIFGVNVFALWYMTAPVLPMMKNQGYGAIVTVSSVAGGIGYPYDSAYVAAKHAAIGFHASLRAELVETGVESYVICPDGVSTEWSTVTEGGVIGDLFLGGIKRSRVIAENREIPRTPLSRMISADTAAQIIIAGIESGEESDIFTHDGTKDRAVRAVTNRAEVEREMLPLFLGMQAEYVELYPQKH